MVDRLSVAAWTLPRRIALHILEIAGDRDRIRAVLLDRAMLEAYWPEYQDLARKHFRDLSDQDKRLHVALVEERKPRERYASGEEVDPADAARWLEAWRRGHLRMLHDELPDDVRAKHADELRDEPEPVPPAEPAPPPALSGDQLSAMSIEAIIEHLAEWQPTPDPFGRGTTIESQAGFLKDAVTRDPDRFARAAESFIGAQPTYARHLVWGLEDVIRQSGPAFAWEPVLRLITRILEQPVAAEDRATFDHDPGWSWSRKEIADLLGTALANRGTHRIPIEQRERVWAALAVLTQGAGEGVGDAARDAVTASLNSTHGSAMHALIAYIQWSVNDDATAPAMERVPEAAAVLERHLDPQHDRSASTRGAVGLRLGQLAALDRSWVTHQRAQLIPPADPVLARMTWSSFVIYNGARRDVLEIFREQFIAAVRELRDARGADRGEPSEADKHLVEHVLMSYVLSWVPLDDELVRGIYTFGPPRVRAHATQFIGRVLKDSRGQLKPEHCDRVRAFWAWRLADVGAQPVAEQKAELEEFGWWFVAGECGDEWLLEQLVAVAELAGAIEPDSLTLDRLAEVASAHPLEATTAVDLLTVEPKRDWLVHASLEEISTILRAGLADPEARDRARRTVNRLVADGYTVLASLL